MDHAEGVAAQGQGAGIALGQWIRLRRAAASISQRELADRAGLSRSYLCDIERGRGKKPSIHSLHAIADALEVDRVDLLRAAGVLDAPSGPEEASRERRLLAVFRGLSEPNQDALERFGRFLLHDEQRWVQPSFIEAELSARGAARTSQSGPTLFDLADE
jgi:transcriptional regulator with XRE-family HTH domain